MVSQPQYTRDEFVACEWKFEVEPEDCYGYASITQSLQECAKQKADVGQENQSRILELLGRASSMMLCPSSINEPFAPRFRDFQEAERSALPQDFSADELVFFENILADVDDLWLKSRLADLLWLMRRPKKLDHARIAMESYTFHAIDPETWHSDINDCWERAARLAIQVKDFDKLNEIKAKLFSALCVEYPRSKFMVLWLADMMDNLNIDSDVREDIASILSREGTQKKNNGDFYSARSYFELSAKKYKQCGDEKNWLSNLVSIAEWFEKEADSRSSSSNMAANSFYENSIQAYRRIPVKHRSNYDVDTKIQLIRTKIAVTGKASLGEMGLVKTPEVDISHIAESSVDHVSGKHSLETALMYFTGLYPGPKIRELTCSAQKIIQKSPITSLFGSSHMSHDGRVVAKTPPMNIGAGEEDPANQAVLNRQIQQQFAIETQLVVNGQILPALNQILMEFRVSVDFLEEVCRFSPIVPQDRERLLGYALWQGFEHDFGNAIYLLCPQIEHIVRTQLKSAGAHTTNIDRDGIENENGLSTLMGMPEANQVFGSDLAFEIRSVFTDVLGFNLRNEIAHGLLDDKSSASISTVYAWWLVLRLVFQSIINGSFGKEKSEVAGEM